MMAVLLAGGKGTRLHPYTAVFPKPLMPLGDMPVIELLLRQLAAAGVTRVVLAVNHLHHLIRAFCGDGRAFGLEIEYCLEDRPMGTAGPLSLMVDRLEEDFIVANGDLLTDLDIAAMLAQHRARGAGASVAVHERNTPFEFGVVIVDDDMRLTQYVEKPTFRHLVSMGFYVFRRDAVLPHLAEGRRLDMPDLLRSIVASGGQVDCIRQDCVWLDIGHPDDYARAQVLFGERREAFLR
jgi:NDP-sugar pyrophosphorylase family protein